MTVDKVRVGRQAHPDAFLRRPRAAHAHADARKLAHLSAGRALAAQRAATCACWSPRPTSRPSASTFPVAEFIKAAATCAKHHVLRQARSRRARHRASIGTKRVRRLRTRVVVADRRGAAQSAPAGRARQRLQVRSAVLVRHQPVRAVSRRSTIEQLESLVDTGRTLLQANVGARRRAMTATPGYRRTTGRDDPSERLWVYGRARLPCRRCGTAIESPETRQWTRRLTYWCPACQTVVIWLALAGGTAAAAAALYGHYYVLPGVADWTGDLPARGWRLRGALPQPALGAARCAERDAGARALRAAGGRASLRRAGLAAPGDDGAGRRDERIPRPEPDRQRPPVPHLLDRPHLERGAVRDCCSPARASQGAQ